ncbi:hypothetical protein [Hymenobacter sp. BRD67]|uniref:hypothetical protein n=1 Tax=Hymenobacter sp. BRD67 TaxID=2675877 RepID=UPI0015679FBC|nr:hypothetical protein [Hymenobacter sp. BRD67]QKG51776.1 hypothetical protein GKZ67_03150 [Hymenobacter sp. BRD67]
MDKTFKILPNKIQSLVIRDLKKSGITVFISTATPFLFLAFKGIPPIKNAFIFFLSLIALISTILFFIFWQTYNFKKLFYANYKIIITNNQIRKIIDFSKKESLFGINRMLLENTKQIYPQNNIAINIKDIDKIIETAHGLLIKSKYANNFFGSGQILIPKEIESYGEINNILSIQITPAGASLAQRNSNLPGEAVPPIERSV